MAVKLIALDIDGTLLDSRWTLPEANRVAIAEATRRGIEVALVTGRRYDFAMTIAVQIGAPLTMIVSNGAIIRTQDGETRLRHLLSRDTAAREFGVDAHIRCPGVDEAANGSSPEKPKQAELAFQWKIFFIQRCDQIAK